MRLFARRTRYLRYSPLSSKHRTYRRMLWIHAPAPIEMRPLSENTTALRTPHMEAARVPFSVRLPGRNLARLNIFHCLCKSSTAAPAMVSASTRAPTPAPTPTAAPAPALAPALAPASTPAPAPALTLSPREDESTRHSKSWKLRQLLPRSTL